MRFIASFVSTLIVTVRTTVAGLPVAAVGAATADAPVAAAVAAVAKTQSQAALDELGDPTGGSSLSISRALVAMDVEAPVDPAALWSEQCTTGYIECENGIEKSTGKTCAQACNDADGVTCCVGFEACKGFYGKICKTGNSCVGQWSCLGAYIDYVINSCVSNIGTQSRSACYHFAAAQAGEPADDGREHIILNSCIGTSTCAQVAYARSWTHTNHPNNTDPPCCYDQGGSWGSIINSCSHDGTTNENAGSVQSCHVLASDGGNVGDIINSCYGSYSCQNVGSGGGIAGHIIDSCHGSLSCQSKMRPYLPSGHIVPTYFQNGILGCCNSPSECQYENIGPGPLDVTCIPGYTGSPTPSPVSSPWEIVYLRLSNNFSNSGGKEISTDFWIGKDRDPEVLLLDKNCKANITGININTTKVITPYDSTHNLLSVHHSMDISDISNSSIWNDTSKEIEVCQVTSLVLPANESGSMGKMVFAEDVRQISVVFDLTSQFNLTTGLAAATIFNETSTTDVSSYVKAYKCTSSNSFTEDDSALAPNQELFVCVVSTAPEVNVEELTSMTVTQQGNPDSDLKVIQSGSAYISSITSIQYDSVENGVVVGTRLPINTFNYADDASISIQGQIQMKLADGSASRKLRVLSGAEIEGDEKAAYELEINLQEGKAVADDVSVMENSATVVFALNKAFALAAALAFAFAAW